MNNVREALAATQIALQAARLEDAAFQARELVCAAFSIGKSDLITSGIIPTREQVDHLAAITNKRIAGYPLQYIVGEWEFYSLPFFVGEGVLIPRADTETLVFVCLEFLQEKMRLQDRPLRVLDLCSGSGCIAITLKKRLPSLEVYAVEKSEKAIKFLHKNIARNEVKVNVINGDALVCDQSLGEFDLIVSNPPYLKLGEMETLQKEVTFEPKMALYGEDDGLHFYRTISNVWKKSLKSDGMLAFEVGFTQAETVCEILRNEGYKNICKKHDLCGIIRCIYTT